MTLSLIDFARIALRSEQDAQDGQAFTDYLADVLPHLSAAEVAEAYRIPSQVNNEIADELEKRASALDRLADIMESRISKK